ncbi:hypothetical protein IPH19_00185 [Candidatus Uhrbacteria bacterium]|nr:MAG: hypothetical protein IPH19_00185 [Candidatus Uhrbacteria bacterium]
MLTLIRAFSQNLPDGRIREMSFHRSDNGLYIASLTANLGQQGDHLWTGELGYCSKPELLKLINELQKEHARNKAQLFTIEVPITCADHVEREGASGPMRKGPRSGYQTATITLSGWHKIELMLQDLESALVWAE